MRRPARAAVGVPAAGVLVGDLIDRGEDSRAVIDRVMADDRITCLMGNHEAMALAFLDDPVAQGPRWLRNGGLQTLASFGVGAVHDGADAAGLRRARNSFAQALGEARIAWLRARPLIWQSGNVAVTHAGADPAVALDAQEARALLWGHPDFGKLPRDDGQWVVHGHVIVDAPHAQAGRIAVDTGAYATGRLSAALIEPGRVTFVTG